jgi:hypothetical protein
MIFRPRVWAFGYAILVAAMLGLALWMLYIQVKGGDWHDFDVFYGAAKAALAGGQIHSISGSYQLPFWYPPWIAWAFLPLAILPRAVGLMLYQLASLVSALGVIHLLSRHFNPRIRLLDEAFMVAMIILMSFQVFMVGQMEFIFLGALVAIVFAAQRQNALMVAFLFPFLLAKPHLIALFGVCLFWRMGKVALLYTGGAIGLSLLVAMALRPSWPVEWLAVLQQSGVRTDGLEFTTLAALLGRQENWLGSANLPVSLALIVLGLGVLWRVRKLPTVPLLSLALALSLLAAPRAYAYDLTLLIPALIWLTAVGFRRWLWLWVLAGLIPLVAAYGTGSYLVTILICALGAWKGIWDANHRVQAATRSGTGGA